MLVHTNLPKNFSILLESSQFWMTDTKFPAYYICIYIYMSVKLADLSLSICYMYDVPYFYTQFICFYQFLLDINIRLKDKPNSCIDIKNLWKNITSKTAPYIRYINWYQQFEFLIGKLVCNLFIQIDFLISQNRFFYINKYLFHARIFVKLLLVYFR